MTFVFLQGIIIAVTVALWRQYARSICSIFPLYIELNSLEKSNKQEYCLEICGIYSFDDSTNLSWRLISLKNFLIFPKNFLNFRSDTIENQGIINLSSYRSKSYASVELSYSKVTLCRLLFCVLFKHSVTWSKKYIIKFPYLPYFRGYFIVTQIFFFFFF